MPSTRRPPLKSVNFSTPTSARKSIHILFMLGDFEPVLRWLENTPTPPDDDLLSYIWMQSIRSNLSEPVCAWMQKSHPEKLHAFNAGLDMVKVLHSPRAWSSLKAQCLMPTLSYEDIAKITASWNKSILAMATNFRKNDTQKKMETYFKECATIQIDFLNHFVPSYRTKTALLRVGLDNGRYASRLTAVPGYGASDPLYAVLQERAQAMAASDNPDMWLLASMDERNTPLSYYLSNSPRVSTWWQPLLSQVYASDFPKDTWQRCLSKTTPDERPVPDNIMVAYHLTAGTPKIREQISTLMATADTAQDVAFEELDLSAIEFDMA